MALYYDIQSAWKDERDAPDGDLDGSLLSIATDLDLKLGNRFNPWIKMYMEGRLTASDLFTKLYIEAYNPKEM